MGAGVDAGAVVATRSSWLVVAVAAATVAACAAAQRPGAGARVVASNLLRGDYAGSASCRGCHPGVYEAWSRSPMHRMTRLPRTAEVRAPFDGRTWRFRDDVVAFESQGGERYMRLKSAADGEYIYRVTRVIGGRYREDFAGLEVTAASASARVVGDPKAELILPASYVFETRSFRLKGYSVMVGERPGLRAGGVWNRTCIFCHNTVPGFVRLWGALAGRGAPRYQGQVVDNSLPTDVRWAYEAGDRHAATAALEEEIRFLGGTVPPRPAADVGSAFRRGAIESSEQFGAEHFIEVGIGCEACHGGSREHVAEPKVLPTFEPRGASLRVRTAAGTPPTEADLINRACARCHQVLFTRYAFTWEGGLRRSAAPGGSSINSGEARDMLLGGCKGALSCTTCHDPHGEDTAERLERLASAAGNGTCTTCHDRYAAPAALRAHAHHDPAGSGGACVACHMPRKNTALDYRLTRYHRIGSATERARVEGDRPLECALCHPRKTVEDLVSTMERFWGRRYDRAALAKLYGDLGQPAIAATLVRGKGHEQITAIHVAREHRLTETLPALVKQLLHPIPLVRFHAKKAVDALAPRPCAVDVQMPRPQVAAAARACLPPGAAWDVDTRDLATLNKDDDED